MRAIQMHDRRAVVQLSLTAEHCNLTSDSRDAGRAVIY